MYILIIICIANVYTFTFKKLFMAIKPTNLYVRIEHDIKEKTEEILSKLGISASNAINMFYKQIILQQGLPFEVKLPSEKITDISQLSEKKLNEKLEKAYEDMLKGRTRNAKDVLSDIRKNNKL